MEAENNSRAVRELNDRLRCRAIGGRILVTPGIVALGPVAALKIVAAVARFDAFDPGNDPYGEHDFGAVTVDGVSILWKIDYYDLDGFNHSPNKANPDMTLRVLTILRSHEW